MNCNHKADGIYYMYHLTLVESVGDQKGLVALALEATRIQPP